MPSVSAFVSLFYWEPPQYVGRTFNVNVEILFISDVMNLKKFVEDFVVECRRFSRAKKEVSSKRYVFILSSRFLMLGPSVIIEQSSEYNIRMISILCMHVVNKMGESITCLFFLIPDLTPLSSTYECLQPCN